MWAKHSLECGNYLNGRQHWMSYFFIKTHSWKRNVLLWRYTIEFYLHHNIGSLDITTICSREHWTWWHVCNYANWKYVLIFVYSYKRIHFLSTKTKQHIYHLFALGKQSLLQMLWPNKVAPHFAYSLCIWINQVLVPTDIPWSSNCKGCIWKTPHHGKRMGRWRGPEQFMNGGDHKGFINTGNV